jgi:NAD(P)-dependent dehydrogenase (short-subunit alcohol dehydrogenase family)
MRLKNRRRSGIGKEIAGAFLREGAKVAHCGTQACSQSATVMRSLALS